MNHHGGKAMKTKNVNKGSRGFAVTAEK